MKTDSKVVSILLPEATAPTTGGCTGSENSRGYQRLRISQAIMGLMVLTLVGCGGVSSSIVSDIEELVDSTISDIEGLIDSSTPDTDMDMDGTNPPDEDIAGMDMADTINPPGREGGSSTVIVRDVDANTTQLIDSAESIALQPTGDGGWIVTGRDNRHIVEFSAEDYGSDDQYVVRNDDGNEFYLWSRLEGGFADDIDGTPSEFEYFDILGFSRYMADTDETRYSVIVDDTSIATIVPVSGTATYIGRTTAEDWSATSSSRRDRIRHWGDVTLTADFADAVVAGELRINSNSPAGSGRATFNAAISGDTFTASDFNGTGALAAFQNGDVDGGFYGPNAEEAAGVYDAVGTNGRVLSGWFGARDQAQPRPE